MEWNNLIDYALVTKKLYGHGLAVEDAFEKLPFPSARRAVYCDWHQCVHRGLLGIHVAAIEELQDNAD